MKTLRLFALALTLLLFFSAGKAQWVGIPDTAFGKWLNTNGFSQCLQGNSTVGWQMDTTCNAVVTETDVDCYFSGITDLTGIQYFDSLDWLYCGMNKLSSLPPLPAGLTQLHCEQQGPSQNPTLTSLPILPSGLTILDFSNNAFTVMPALPPGLTSLDCTNNQIGTIGSLPSTLRSFYCSDNPISSLPVLPATLQTWYVSNCGITALPVLPIGLKALHCDENNLGALPVLPDSLETLFCDNNALTVLPVLPATLEWLHCNHNYLTYLPNLPSTLWRLKCGYNPISALPVLPATLRDLVCNGTNISSLPELPDGIDELTVDNNPFLTCLPHLKEITMLHFFNTPITCLPNYPPNISSSMPSLSTVPICGYPNPNNCQVYWNLTGKGYQDANTNCIYNSTDSIIKKLKVQLWENGSLLQQNVAGNDGSFFFDTDHYGTYQLTIDTSNLPFRILCPATGSLTNVVSASDSFEYNMDFALECKPGFDLEAKSVFGAPFRPANNTTLEVSAGDAASFYNGRCAAGASGSVTLSFTGPVSYVGPASGALTPTLSGNTLTWNVADFGNVNFSTDFDVIMQTDTNAQIGQLVSFTLTANPIAGDNNPANNTLSIDFPVVNSYDPNDKQVSPPGNIDTLQEYLTYTVRFQNTGNAEAQHVYITDTLDGDIEPASFQLLAYSHQPMVQIDGKAVKFNFPNINLPDSFSNEPGSHGYVQYKVKLKDNLPIGATINNTAFIYFDFSPPVVTNTTTNTVSLEVDTTVGISSVKADAQVFVYPNPANNSVTITVSENIQGATVTLTDVLGRKASDPIQLNGKAATINTQQVPDGVYLLNVQSRGGASVVRRLVIKR